MITNLQKDKKFRDEIENSETRIVELHFSLRIFPERIKKRKKTISMRNLKF